MEATATQIKSPQQNQASASAPPIPKISFAAALPDRFTLTHTCYRILMLALQLPLTDGELTCLTHIALNDGMDGTFRKRIATLMDTTDEQVNNYIVSLKKREVIQFISYGKGENRRQKHYRIAPLLALPPSLDFHLSLHIFTKLPGAG